MVSRQYTKTIMKGNHQSPDRFWSKVNKNGPIQDHMDTPCWEYMGRQTEKGYCRVQYQKQRTYVHRVSYLLTHGSLTEGMMILHDCDNPRCCNPSHLREGTHRDNMDDKIKRGTGLGTNKGRPPVNRKLTPDQVRYIRTRPFPQRQLCVMMGVSRDVIKKIQTGKSYTDIE